MFARRNIRDLRAVIAGGGALGNEVVKILGLLGAAQVLIVDPDRVEPSNLTRCIFFRQGDRVGQNKAAALADAARPIFPDTEFSSIESEIADVGFGRLRDAHILFSCVDSDLARLEIAYISTKLGLPVCDAGLGTPDYSHGRVSWFPGKTGACFGCKLTPRKLRELLVFWDATIRPCSDPVPDEIAPATPTMAAITGSAQVEMAIRWMAQGMAESMTFEISLDADPRSSYFRTPQSVSCPFHGSRDDLLSPMPSADATFHDLLESSGESAFIALDWPISTRVRCLDCEVEWAPMRRAAAVRRSGVCPCCASRSILELESIRIIERDSPWSRCVPRALGLPENHWFTIRFRNGDR